MKGFLSLMVLLLLFGFGNSNKTIEGDLYFGFFRFGNFYNLPDSTIKKLDSILNSAPRTNEDKVLFVKYKILKKENLLHSPFVELKLDNDSIIILYLNNTDYGRIKIHKIKDLQDNLKKIRLKVNCKNLGYNLFKCENILEMKKINGQTLINSRKLKIEDYQ